MARELKERNKQRVLNSMIFLLIFLPVTFLYGCVDSEERALKMQETREETEPKLPALKQNIVTQKYKNPKETDPYQFVHSDPHELDELEAEIKKTGQLDPIQDD